MVHARRCFVEAVALLAAVDIACAFGWLGPAYVAMPLLTGGLASLAWRAHASSSALGLGRVAVGRGVRYGLGAVGAVAVVLSLSAAASPTRGFLNDQRGAVGGWHLIEVLLVSIAVLTAVPEEFAFRGVVYGAGRELWGSRRSAVVSLVLFGLWQIAPTLHMAGSDTTIGRVSHSGGGALAAVAVTVAATFVAGLLFCFLRERSGSLIASVLAHVATDGPALVAAWLAPC